MQLFHHKAIKGSRITILTQTDPVFLTKLSDLRKIRFLCFMNNFWRTCLDRKIQTFTLAKDIVFNHAETSRNKLHISLTLVLCNLKLVVESKNTRIYSSRVMIIVFLHMRQTSTYYSTNSFWMLVHKINNTTLTSYHQEIEHILI